MRNQVFTLLVIPFFLFYALPVSALEKEEKAWQKELVYYISVDRFQNGNPHNDGADRDPTNPVSYHGGDLEGIYKKLDYIQDMGFTTIVLSSLFASESGGEAGDYVKDLQEVDKHFGSKEDLIRLVNEVHKRDMKILIEFVANHVSPNHPWLIDETKKSWFHEKVSLSNAEDDGNRIKGWYKDLPDLATEHDETRDYLISTADMWKDETNIDGYYINHADTVESEFWQVFSKELKNTEEEFYLVGSLLNPELKQEYKESGFTSILNQEFYEQAQGTFSTTDTSFADISNVVEQSSNTLSTYLDSDKTIRFTRKSIENKKHPGIRLKTALSYIYTIPGTPVVYYGTEIALDGGEPPENKPLMNFQSDDELITYINKLATIRKELPALTMGDYEVLYEKDGIIVFKRNYEKESLIVVINNTSASQKVFIPEEEIAENKELRGLLTGDIFKEENGQYEFIIDRELAEVYEIKDKTGLNLPFISVFVIVPLLFLGFLLLAYKRGKRNNIK